MSAKGQGPTKVELLGTEVLVQRHFRYEQIALQTDTFAGKTSAPMYREVLRSGAAIAVLLYDPQAHRFVLIEQFRVGAWLNHFPSPWILECVAGRIDDGESAEEAVRREAKEETNCRVDKMEFCGSYLASPGICDELVDVYIGQVDSRHVGGVHGVKHEQEDIRSLVMDVDEAIALADRGAINNVMCAIGLFWFARHGEGLRQRWLAALVAD